PVRIADASNHPSATYGLLFMENDVVREWKVDGTVTDLVTLPGTTDRLDRVEMYDSSVGGALVAILRRNAVGEFEIVMYDRAAKAIRWTQTVPITAPTALKLSPDNFWVAFASSGTDAQPGIIGTVLIEAPEQTFTLAECQPSCASIRWRFANSHLIWSDEAGIWDVDPLLGAAQIPVPLLEPPIQILNSGGNNVTGVFTILSFSPSGRYLLLSKGAFPEAIPSIYDIESQRLVDIPGSFLYTDPGTSVAWMFEDKLAVARAGLAADGRPGIEVWQLAPETDAFLIRERISYVGTSASQAPFVIARLADGRVRFAMLDFSHAEYTKGNGIYQVDPRIDELVQLNNMPFIRATQAVWVPDGSGVLLLTANKVYYISGNGGGIYEMDSFLGASAERFAWVAP
ncbi:MAG TPA: hypothetical protein PK530_22900, partial [Anaerolineales bacterium]|nr:hypothetical protein [Anaerolineales bacterium]